MFDKVIAGLDGTERGADALALARVLVAPGGEIVGCHAERHQDVSSQIDLVGFQGDAQAEATAPAAHEESQGTTLRSVVVASGSPAAVLKDVAVEEGAELIALGSSHRGRVGEIFPGSVTLEVIRSSTSWVAVAPIGYHDASRSAHFERIGVGYDAREPVADSLRAAVALCERTGAALRVIAVADDATAVSPATTPYGEALEARREVAQKAVDAALAVVPAGVSAAGEVLGGEPAEALLKAGEELDLLVLGSHGRGWLDRLLMGSVSEQVVRGPTCPVLIVVPDA